MSEFDLTNMSEEINTEDIIDENNGDGEPAIGGGDAPEVSVKVTVSECLYHFKFTAERKGKDINMGTLNFTLAPNPSFPSIGVATVTPASTAQPTYTAPSGTWSFGPLNNSVKTRTVEFDATYTGAMGVTIIPTVTATYQDGGQTKPIIVKREGIDKTVQQCPTTNPCCEASSCQVPVEVTFQPCDDVKTKDVDVLVAPKGRKLSVKLNLPQVCPRKDINVGIFVTEVVGGKEVPFAHKVIKRPAAGTGEGCKDDRDCNCVNFMIHDDSPCANTRIFKIRTEANYVDTANDFLDDCKCKCPMV